MHLAKTFEVYRERPRTYLSANSRSEIADTPESMGDIAAIERFLPAPAGFKSWEEQQLEAKLAAAKLAAKRERLERLKALKEQEFEADFEIWIGEPESPATRAPSPRTCDMSDV